MAFEKGAFPSYVENGGGGGSSGGVVAASGVNPIGRAIFTHFGNPDPALFVPNATAGLASGNAPFPFFFAGTKIDERGEPIVFTFANENADSDSFASGLSNNFFFSGEGDYRLKIMSGFLDEGTSFALLHSGLYKVQTGADDLVLSHTESTYAGLVRAGQGIPRARQTDLSLETRIITLVPTDVYYFRNILGYSFTSIRSFIEVEKYA